MLIFLIWRHTQSVTADFKNTYFLIRHLVFSISFYSLEIDYFQDQRFVIKLYERIESSK
jgi:hypothetical protein